MASAFGLDLSGYSSGGSAIARATIENDNCTAAILQDQPFRKTRSGTDALGPIGSEEADFLVDLINVHPVYVDVPIDLQDLLTPERAHYIWELTNRPVDKAFQALPPLADRIGGYVARMRNLWHHLNNRLGCEPLGTSLFETYPAASLWLSGLPYTKYKGRCYFDNHNWVGHSAKQKDEQNKNNTLASILNTLSWHAGHNFHITNDEFDAIVCALTGTGNVLSDTYSHCALSNRINTILGGNGYASPHGYQLLTNIPCGIWIRRE